MTRQQDFVMKIFGLKKTTVAIVFLAAAIGFILYNANKPFRSNTRRTVSESEQPEEVIEESQKGAAVDSGEDSCELTASDGQGPYYISDSPTRTNLAPEDAEGESLVINGQVLDQDCEPIPNATVDIWHADAEGVYQDDWFRGKVVTDENGEYQFETVMPASYGSGATRRPAHVHYKVIINGEDVFTSQIYFEGRGLPEFAQTKVVEVESTEDGFEGELDIVLEK